MKPLSIDDIRASFKGGDTWETWIPGAPKEPMSKKPLRHITHAATEDEARGNALAHFEPVYPVLMVTGAVHFKAAMLQCVERMRELGQLSEDTARDYANVLERSLPDEPKTPIDSVTKNYLQGLYAKLHTGGGSHGDGLSVKSLKKLNAVISKSYQYMIDHGVNIQNPACKVAYPKPNAEEVKRPRALSETELALFQRAIESQLGDEADGARLIKRKSALFGALIALHTGMRCGEVCALRRGDVRRGDNVIRVTHTYTNAGVLKQPKTKSGNRSIAYDSTLEDAFRDHFEWQASYLTEKQQRSDSTPVCCDAAGAHIKPAYMSAQFKQLCLDAGIELERGESIHTLRHTHLSELLTAGANIKAVQGRAGHASAATTLDNYAHVMPGEDAAMAARFDGIAERTRKAGGPW